jgi:sigma-B regulation protein RsbU (phosphoserine phosphatase)
VPGWSICGHYQAARQVGGDFYDFVPLPGGRFGLVIADVADKGVPAALFMALSRTLVRATAIDGRPPGEAIPRANQLILSDTHTDMFVTLFYGVLAPTTGELCYVIAGHNPPRWWSQRTQQVQRLPGRGLPLGVMEDMALDEERLALEPGDVLLLYTDGVTEALNLQGEEFGEARLAALVAAHAAEDANTLMAAIVAAQAAFTGGLPPFDDITMVAVKRQSG